MQSLQCGMMLFWRHNFFAIFYYGPINFVLVKTRKISQEIKAIIILIQTPAFNLFLLYSRSRKLRWENLN